MTESELIGITNDGAVRTVTLDRPAARNALSVALQVQLAHAIAAADADPEVACIILTGADPAFCAGLDLKELGQGVAPSTLSGPDSCFTALAVRNTPLIGAINGPCATGGLELALACDFLVASERARFGDTHGRVGFTPAGGMSVLLPQAVGLRKAREMSFTGAFIDAAEAYRLGLVNHVVPHEELVEFAVSVAQSIASADRSAVLAIKGLYDRGSRLPAGEALKLELEVFRDREVPADLIESRRSSLIERGRSGGAA